MNKAFSLLELMVVVAIIGLLAAIAVPSYKEYLIRVRVNNAFTQMANLKDKLVETYVTTGSYPTSTTFLGTAVAGGSATTSLLSNTIAIDLGINSINYTNNSAGVYLYLVLNAAKIGLSSATDVNMAIVAISGVAGRDPNIVYTYCGYYGSSASGSANVPLRYQPSICTCNITSTLNWVSGSAEPSC